VLFILSGIGVGVGVAAVQSCCSWATGRGCLGSDSHICGFLKSLRQQNNRGGGRGSSIQEKKLGAVGGFLVFLQKTKEKAAKRKISHLTLSPVCCSASFARDQRV